MSTQLQEQGFGYKKYTENVTSKKIRDNPKKTGDGQKRRRIQENPKKGGKGGKGGGV